MSILRKEIAAIREDYIKGVLDERDVSVDPLIQFEAWFNEAVAAEVYEPTAMVLSTVSKDNLPSSRVVLLKDIKPEGLSFFTNYESRKAKDMEHNQSVSLLFFWNELQRQVRIEGVVHKLPALESDEYFDSRPRGSQIGAWASPQSDVLVSRGWLENRVMEFESKFDAKSIDRPLHWGGYLVQPRRMEFWQGRLSRLHDRIQYEWMDNQWLINRLAP